VAIWCYWLTESHLFKEVMKLNFQPIGKPTDNTSTQWLELQYRLMEEEAFMDNDCYLIIAHEEA